ncbi:uncharacterized protein LOC113312519 [Papaver somniferum]|uniref:uncharacterized protein LOC113312519 n=1 Tax=Papaver somniferum TaxID=3469 RepID=UPI000E703ECA|nr:uncharacterized protein LOC113312519 [Papaver somniferum]
MDKGIQGSSIKMPLTIIRPTFDGLELPKISMEQSIGMEKPIEEEEVKKVIWGFGRNKSPGPDGHTMKFFKAVWDIIKPELMVVMKELEQTGNIDWRLNRTNIILIPKYSRQITDVILIALELIDSREREGKPGLILKLNLEKAFYSVSWSCLDYTRSSKCIKKGNPMSPFLFIMVVEVLSVLIKKAIL